MRLISLLALSVALTPTPALAQVEPENASASAEPGASAATIEPTAEDDDHHDHHDDIVVTGQQPGLMGGPLFTFHKAATAIRLCREINEVASGPRVVPLFWNHSDDHDHRDTEDPGGTA